MEITIKIENNAVESNSTEDLSTKIHRRIQSIEKLLKAAGTTALSTFDRLVYFKSSNAVKQVVDPETIMNALVFK